MINFHHFQSDKKVLSLVCSKNWPIKIYQWYRANLRIILIFFIFYFLEKNQDPFSQNGKTNFGFPFFSEKTKKSFFLTGDMSMIIKHFVTFLQALS